MKVNFSRIVIRQDKDWMLNILTNLIQCKICMNILNDPYDCLCCNQTFCKNCISNYIKTNKKCPYSNFFQEKENNLNSSSLNNIKPTSSNIKKLVNSLKFNCSYQNNGCNCEIAIEDLIDHESNCQYKTQKPNAEILNKLENLNNNGANTNKFKFQDSCMSFKKLDLSQLDYSITNQNKNSTSNMITNQKINEKIDSIHDMLTSFLKNNFMTEPNKNDKKLIKKKTCTTPISDKSKLLSNNNTNTPTNNNFELESTPKFTKKTPKNLEQIQELRLQSHPHATSEDKILSEIKQISSKLTNLERFFQASSSLHPQNYLIDSSGEYCNSILSTRSSKIDNKPTISINSSFQQGTPKPTTPKPGNSKLNIRKKFAQQVIKNTNVCVAKKPSNNRVFNSVNMNNSFYQNLNVTNPNIKGGNEEIIDKDYFDKLISEKIEGLKTYIDEKMSNEIKQYFFELFIDNSNLLIQKMDESFSSLHKAEKEKIKNNN